MPRRWSQGIREQDRAGILVVRVIGLICIVGATLQVLLAGRSVAYLAYVTLLGWLWLWEMPPALSRWKAKRSARRP